MTAPAGLVLAAGAGRRIGGPKALLVVDGELLVERAARVLRDAGCDRIVVVLGAAAAEVAGAARLDGCTLVVNDGWEAGMGSSLRVGLDTLTAAGASAAVVLLVDQPGVTAAVVRRLLDRRGHTDRPAIVASYDGQPRNPVVLDASVWPDVRAAATGDIGARGWLRGHPHAVESVACDDLGSAADIDTLDDLTRILED